jgi:hypothetical protein
LLVWISQQTELTMQETESNDPIIAELIRPLTAYLNTRVESPGITSTSSTTRLHRKASSVIESHSSVQDQSAKKLARPLGTFARRCDQCQRLKHILLTECATCTHVTEIDLKDCKCLTKHTSLPIIDFICPTCLHPLNLDEYLICAHRTCQTVLTAPIESFSSHLDPDSTTIFDVSYPHLMKRSLAVQVKTLPINTFPLVESIDQSSPRVDHLITSQ